MKRSVLAGLLALAVLLAVLVALRFQSPDPGPRDGDEPPYAGKEAIYGHKYGTALTMDVFAPPQGGNGAAVIAVVSGAWHSERTMIAPNVRTSVQPHLDRGYTVFAVCHGSSPKYSLPEMVEDLHRAVRFIRHHAKEYDIDPGRLGILGGDSGGHLALMQGCAGRAGDPEAADPVERESSRVQAVVAFYAPTDFLNWGAKGQLMLGTRSLIPAKGAFDFTRLDPKTESFVLITDEKARQEIAKQVSPVTHVAKDNPPTLLVHGEKDWMVPAQQSQTMAAKLKVAGAPYELIVKPGGVHDDTLVKEHMSKALDWFDKYLAKKAAAP